MTFLSAAGAEIMMKYKQWNMAQLYTCIYLYTYWLSMWPITFVKLTEVYIPTPTFKSKQDLITSIWDS